MAPAVVTKQAIHRTDPEEGRRHPHRQPVHRVLRGAHRHIAEDDEVRLAVYEAVAALADHLSGHDGIALVHRNRVFDVVVIGLTPAEKEVDVRGGLRVLEQVAEEHRPLVDVLGRIQQLVDERVAFVGCLIAEEFRDVLRRRDAARDVQVNAADEFLVGAKRRRRDVIPLHPVEQDLVNYIFPWDHRRVDGR
jgi:hypothetical protein